MNIQQLLARKETTRLIRFGVVGLSGTAIDFALLTLLKTAGLPTLPANTLSYSAGIVSNYTLHRRWTFADAEKQSIPGQLARFALISVIGLLLNNVIVLLLEAIIAALVSGHDVSYIPAKIAATGIVMIWNYSANRFWTFGSHRNKHPKESLS